MASVLKHLRSSTTDKRPTASGLADGQLAINTASGTPGLYFKDSNGGVVKVGPVHIGATAPNATPAGSAGNSLGEQWLDSAGGGYRTKYWDGSAWRSPVITNADIGASAAINLSKLATGALPSGITIASSNIVDGTIVDADISATAAIGLSKLATGALPSGITIASSNIIDGSIVNADIATGAAIAGTKISPDFGGQNITTSGNVQTASINSGPLAGFRNAIINGNFDIWQRGTSFTNPANTAYVADRWQVVWNGSGATRTVERVAFPLGQTDVPGEPAYMLRFSQTVAGSGATFNSLVQRIEGVRAFAGQQVTVSFYIRATASITLPTIQFIQSFGTGGSPSSQVFTTLLSNVSVTTAWQRIQATVTVPSISGKTIGNDDNDNLTFDIALPINATFSVDIARIQVEPGPVATPFERRPIGTELALCQRYYQVGVYSIPSTGYVPFAQYVVPLRAVPTVVAIIGTYTGSGGTISDLGGRGIIASSYATSDHRITYSASAEL